MNILRTVTTIMASILLGAMSLSAQQADTATTDHVAAIKQSLQESSATLRHYTWVETTVISIKGNEKKRMQNSCFYGADGGVQKTQVGGETESSSKKRRGLRGRIAEKKTEEITDEMHEAMALIKQYIPPKNDKIQAAKDAGRLAIVPPGPKGVVKVTITDYLKEGDSLAFDLNAATNRITGVAVTSYTDSDKHPVDLDVTFSTLEDGTTYSKTTDLKMPASDLEIAITNSGYKKNGS